MPWLIDIAHVIGGAFVANSLPHLTAGIAGRSLQTPFASPPFRGLSSPRVNVAWALANLACAYLLLIRVGALELHDARAAGVAFAGFAGMAFVCSRSFERVRQEAAD